MKGVILKCVKELVEQKAGADTWKAIMKEAGIDETTPLLVGSDFEDSDAMRFQLQDGFPQAAAEQVDSLSGQFYLNFFIIVVKNE